VNEVIDIQAYDGVRKVIHNSAVPIRDEHQAIVGAVIVNEDITERKATERALEASVKEMHMLATRLMHAQDDERRRIAQMLHETTAQDLAALKMMLARISRTSKALSESDRQVLAEAVDLAEQSMVGVRTLSYLLHPPFLDERGLLSALRWYVEGFSRRSGIAVDLDLPGTLERLPQAVETTLFRIVQEALINIHRHANSPKARIRLRTAGDGLTLEVEDRGRGMSPDFVARLVDGDGAFGIGVAGMRERLKRLGGSFDIESSPAGTTVRASVPFPPKTA
jgi:signal transduction histidine kinase